MFVSNIEKVWYFGIVIVKRVYIAGAQVAQLNKLSLIFRFRNVLPLSMLCRNVAVVEIFACSSHFSK